MKLEEHIRQFTGRTTRESFDPYENLYEGVRVRILRGRFKDKEGRVDRVDFDESGQVVGDQVDVIVDDQIVFLGVDDIVPLSTMDSQRPERLYTQTRD